MFRTKTALCLSLATLAAAGPISAAEVTLTTALKGYGGEGAYLAIYLTDADGAYKGSLWLAGGKTKYWKHLSDWFRATGGSATEVDGMTGASVGSGGNLVVTVDVADALIDAGYQIRMDTAVEDMPDRPAEIVVPLTRADAGTPVAGKGYVKSFQFDM
ncbi:DUF2271 domain-containing protein [Paracoccaceae bacterium Fryx2]|nr:DUF2271 domain-containing protein [Paracoccaceae bacterium Fryx2]